MISSIGRGLSSAGDGLPKLTQTAQPAQTDQPGSLRRPPAWAEHAGKLVMATGMYSLLVTEIIKAYFARERERRKRIYRSPGRKD